MNIEERRPGRFYRRGGSEILGHEKIGSLGDDFWEPRLDHHNPKIFPLI
jgi:hypothetical protein